MTSAMQNGHNIWNFDWEESLQVRFSGNEYNRFSKEFAESADRIKYGIRPVGDYMHILTEK